MGNNKSFLATTGFYDSEDHEPTEKETIPEIHAVPEVPETSVIPEVRKPRPESKTARLQVLLTPSLKDTLKRISNAEGKSVNELVNLALIQYTDTYIKELGV